MANTTTLTALCIRAPPKQRSVGFYGSRNASVSSITSEQWHVNAEDRFMNPRAVPTPKMSQLATSFNTVQLPYSSDSSPVASPAEHLQPTAKQTLLVPNMHRLPHMASCDALSRRGRLQNKPAGLRQAFKTLRSGRSASPETHYKHIIDWNPIKDGQVTISAPQTPEPARDSAPYFEPKLAGPVLPSRGLLLRTSSDTSIPTTSFLEHRRERSRSRSRGPSSLRGSYSLEQAALDMERALHQRNALETLVEAASPQYTPVVPLYAAGLNIGKGAVTSLVAEKRLPTLPNTPSSAYPPSTAGMSSPRKFEQQMEGFCSRFSASTIDTTYQPDMFADDTVSGSPEWLDNSVLVSPSSDSTVEDSVASPVLERAELVPAIRPVTTRSPELMGVFSPDEVVLRPEYDNSFVSDPSSLTPTQRVSSQIYDGASNFRQLYRLPESDDSMLTTPKALPPSTGGMNDLSSTSSHTRVQSQSLRDRRSGYVHSESMQQLMQELSYLGGVITSN